ncbi:lamin tail domain-containing protein [Halorubrum sp. FL23]|uniref:lamin tail domain-containing protein n=1 Tax=Halorubrum sp. FL23 TaxID=3458704 RepID=UPI00403459A9
MSDLRANSTDRASPASASETEFDVERDSHDSDSKLSRRTFLIGGGLLAGGLAGAYFGVSSGSDDSTFILRQGYLRYEVDPLRDDDGEMTVREFYDYQRQRTSADPEGDIIRDDAASRLFVYDGPVDASLVFLHGSPEVDHGGTAKFSFSGLSRDAGEWALRDDPTAVDDDFEPWAGGNQQVEWGWGPHKTDGGAYWGVLDRDDFSITVTPKTLRGVDTWTFLSGDLGELESHTLSQERPVQLKPAKGRTVKSANVDIMPDAADNEFDPYASDTITVAVEPPPDGVDESEWVAPEDLDPGNYSVNFGSKRYLAGENAAQPQSYAREDGTLYLRYTATAANFSLDSAYGYLVSKTGEKTFVRGRDTVRPGGFDNVDTEESELVVTDVQPDPEGHDADRLNEEYVAFENDGDERLDLTGYTVEDAQGAAFDVPDGFVLEANAGFRLHTGTGDRSQSDLYWGRGRPVWNNDGDVIRVIDANANTVLEYAYPRK